MPASRYLILLAGVLKGLVETSVSHSLSPKGINAVIDTNPAVTSAMFGNLVRNTATCK